MTHEPKSPVEADDEESILPGSYQSIPSYADDEEGSSSRQASRRDVIQWARTRLFWVLLPSFVSRYYGHSDVKAPKADDTSYLNGLRGVAALVVVLQHTTEVYYSEVHKCYGPGEGTHYYQLPFIRLVVLGSFSVALFFVISGFALSYGPLRKIHAGNSEAAVLAMPSSIFRRPIRLFLPILPVYVLSWLMVQAQLMYLIGSIDPITAHSNIWLEAWAGLKNWFFLDTAPYWPAPYFPQLWTLHDEHMGSLLVFLCCIAFARTSALVRISAVAACAAWQFCVSYQWANVLFMAGMLLAEMRLVVDAQPELKATFRRRRGLFSLLILVIALFFGSWPIVGDISQCVGFRHFASWAATSGMTQMRFMHTLAAPATIFALEGLPAGQALFNYPPILYLGEISFSFYLIHWFVANTWAKRIALGIQDAGHPKVLSWLVALSVTLVTGVWSSDLLWRFGDVPSVKFARWLSKRLGIAK